MKIFRVSLATLALGLFVPAAGGVTQQKTILFFGDSITAGYGVEPEDAYPALIQKKLDARGWPYRVINAGLSGDTTAAGEQRLAWALRERPDILVLALGGNDGLRGIPPETVKSNLQRMIDFAKTKKPPITIVLAGMQMPPNYGKAYTAAYAALFPDLAKRNKIALIPFFLEGVGGVAELNLPDRIHPTPKGHAAIAETVWKTLEPLLMK